MTSNEVRQKFLEFFKKKGHKIIPSASLVPSDPSVLFTTAGMQQFKQYYTNPENAEKELGGISVASVQKCIRTGDIDEVGDNTHLTFFEMLGNFSFGGYWKKEAIEYAHEFITKELGLPIDYITVFKGEGEIPKDEESRKIWEGLGVGDIREQGMADLFWGPTGEEGPCGPTTEIYIGGVEVWNIVFNEYYKSKDGKYTPLDVKGIDTGMGLERLMVQVQKKTSVYETDLFKPLIERLDHLSVVNGIDQRIVADHIKAAIILIYDGVVPGNEKSSYVLRKLIRRAVRKLSFITTPADVIISLLTNQIAEIYELKTDFIQNFVRKVLLTEVKEVLDIDKDMDKLVESTVKKYLDKINIPPLAVYEYHKGQGIPENQIAKNVPGKALFELVTSKGIDKDILLTFLGNKSYIVFDSSKKELDLLLENHKKLSQTASQGMFKGGLANHEEKTVRLHTAHHLLLAALQNVVDPKIKQRGSNINEERLRMDFLCDHKLTDGEKKKVEDWVKDKIEKGLSVVRREMPLAEAQNIGAEMEFGAKYPDVVSVYFIEDERGNAISKEFCGGPHVANTSELKGKFKIQKEEAVSAGVRRIKAVLE